MQFTYHIDLRGVKYGQLNAIDKALEILISKYVLMIQPCDKSESNNTLAWVVGTAEVPWRMRMITNKRHVLSKFFSWWSLGITLELHILLQMLGKTGHQENIWLGRMVVEAMYSLDRFLNP